VREKYCWLVADKPLAPTTYFICGNVLPAIYYVVKRFNQAGMLRLIVHVFILLRSHRIPTALATQHELPPQCCRL
jgi:hypothetical protein